MSCYPKSESQSVKVNTHIVFNDHEKLSKIDVTLFINIDIMTDSHMDTHWHASYHRIELWRGGSLTRIFLVIKSWLIEARSALKSESVRSVTLVIRDHLSNSGQQSLKISCTWCRFSNITRYTTPLHIKTHDIIVNTKWQWFL